MEIDNQRDKWNCKQSFQVETAGMRSAESSLALNWYTRTHCVSGKRNLLPLCYLVVLLHNTKGTIPTTEISVLLIFSTIHLTMQYNYNLKQKIIRCCWTPKLVKRLQEWLQENDKLCGKWPAHRRESERIQKRMQKRTQCLQNGSSEARNGRVYAEKAIPV